MYDVHDFVDVLVGKVFRTEAGADEKGVMAGVVEVALQPLPLVLEEPADAGLHHACIEGEDDGSDG